MDPLSMTTQEMYRSLVALWLTVAAGVAGLACVALWRLARRAVDRLARKVDKRP